MKFFSLSLLTLDPPLTVAAAAPRHPTLAPHSQSAFVPVNDRHLILLVAKWTRPQLPALTSDV